MDEIDRLRFKVDDLELRLEEYHEWMEGTLDHDRHFLLKPAWGIVNVAGLISSFYLSGWITNKVAPDGGILAWIVGAASFLIAISLFTWYSHSGLQGDIKKLHRLPQWGDKIEARESHYDVV